MRDRVDDAREDYAQEAVRGKPADVTGSTLTSGMAIAAQFHLAGWCTGRPSSVGVGDDVVLRSTERK
jgi:hypothetical protein